MSEKEQCGAQLWGVSVTPRERVLLSDAAFTHGGLLNSRTQMQAMPGIVLMRWFLGCLGSVGPAFCLWDGDRSEGLEDG